MQDYLLEIGVEELPARYINNAINQLENDFVKFLNENKLKYEEVIKYSTPRRLAILVKNLDDSQEDSTVEIKGPSAKIAYDEENNPSKALLGFMKSQGLEEKDIEIRDEYIYAQKTIKAKSIEEIFEEGVPQTIKGINFPKNMKWGGKDLRFARPVRWLVSVYGSKVLPIDLEDIDCGNITRGHRFLGSSEIEINNPSDYEELLKENYVIADSKKRRNLIKRESDRLSREMSGEIFEDESLLEELTNIVEYPTAILGKIKDEHLELPNIVITTSMKEHLRFVPIYKDEKTLLPYFVSIVNGTDEHKDVVIKGNEKVLGARLEDAKFFYNEDLQKDFLSLSNNLTGITYHEKLGTMDLKVERIMDLSEAIGENLDIAKKSQEQLKRAAELSKADLLTQMVSEFTDLQGIMGEDYANHSGEDSLVSSAIREQYMPRFAGDDLPETTIGSILSISDKLDTIAGMFAIRNIPTGSQDPFGLRRATIGIINIIRNKGWKLSIKEIIKSALYIYVDKNNLVFDYDKVSENIYNFIMSRIKVILLDEGIRYDVVDSLLNSEADDIYSIFAKAKDLKNWFDAEDRSKTVETFTRLNNIAVKAESEEFDPTILNEYEKSLYAQFNSVSDRLSSEGKVSNYSLLLDEAITLEKPINDFLDNVLVFDEDEKVRNNRLGLLSSINNVIKNIVDFSKIVL